MNGGSRAVVDCVKYFWVNKSACLSCLKVVSVTLRCGGFTLKGRFRPLVLRGACLTPHCDLAQTFLARNRAVFVNKPPRGAVARARAAPGDRVGSLPRDFVHFPPRLWHFSWVSSAASTRCRLLHPPPPAVAEAAARSPAHLSPAPGAWNLSFNHFYPKIPRF